MSAALAPDVAAFMAALADQPAVSFADMSAHEAREAVRAMTGELDMPADKSVAARDLRIEAGDGRSVALRAYSAPGIDRNGPVILFIHGGGWVTGDLDTHDSLCRYLSVRAGLRIVAVDYRRPPEHAFPAAYDDALAAAEYLCSPGSKVECGAGLVLSGDSAGGGIAAALARALPERSIPVVGQLLFYPVLDVANRSESYRRFGEGYLLSAGDMEYFIDCYVPEQGARGDARCSPLLAGSMAGLPPLSILTCGHDVLRDEGRAYARACADAGVAVRHIEAAGHIHGIGTLRAAMPSATSFIDDAIDALGVIMKKELELRATGL